MEGCWVANVSGRYWFLLALLVAWTLLPRVAVGQPKQEADLPPLPEVPSLELSEPSPESVTWVRGLLDRLVSEDNDDRKAASAELRTLPPGAVAAIRHDLDVIADRADRSRMKQLLLEIRREARNEVRQKMRAEGKRGEVDTPDYLDMVVAHPHVEDPAWRDLVQVLGLSRMLVAIQTIDATRALVHIYVRFDFLRIDTQLQLEHLGDRAVPALIETRRHQAKKIADWAEKQLDLLGKAIPTEAVRIDDLEVLADVLRAFGRVRDPDAARVIISFSNSERAQIRTAARQGVALMGEIGNWQLRDAYENLVGKKPPRDWSWQRTARELFGEYDRLRMAKAFELFARGKSAETEGRLDDMREAYDKVLARSPVFERSAEMAPGYVAYAQAKADDDRQSALEALRRAERIVGPDDALAKHIRSLRLTLEGELLLAEGIVDQTLFRRALEVDPKNDRARRALDGTLGSEQAVQDRRQRWLGPVVIGSVALVAVLFLLLWPARRHSPTREGEAKTERDDREQPNHSPEADPGPNDSAGKTPASKPPDGGPEAAQVPGEVASGRSDTSPAGDAGTRAPEADRNAADAPTVSTEPQEIPANGGSDELA